MNLQVRERIGNYLTREAPTLIDRLGLLARAPEGATNLRQLVLSLAVQGRLVEQSPGDEPAATLLAQIASEKHRLVANGRMRREPKLDPLERDHRNLPSGWKLATLADVCAVVTDGDHLPPPKAARGVPFLVIGDVRSGRIDVSSAERFVSPEYFGSLDWSRRPMAGDILYTTVGSFGIPVAVIRDEDFCFQRHIALLRPGVAALQPYLHLALMSRQVFAQASLGATGIAQKTVSLAVLRSISVPLPPLAEQRRIVARVEELMKLCDALEQSGRLADEQHARLTSTLFNALAASESAHALAENWQRIAEHFDLLLDRPEAIDALEQAILQLALRGLLTRQDERDEPASPLLHRLRAEQDRMIAMGQIRREKVLPQLLDEDCPYELPAGWRWARLGELANFIDYRGRTPVKTSSGVPLITAKNVRQGFINREPREFIAADAYEGWMTRGFPRIGDLLFTTEAPLGNIAVIDIAERFALAQRVICFGLYEIEMSGVLSVFLQSPWMQEAFAAQATGVTAQGIKSARLQLIPIPVPPLAEQHRIVARVQELRHLCAQLRERLTQTRHTQSQLADAIVADATT